MASLADERRHASARMIAEDLHRLVDIMCPDTTLDTKDSLLSYMSTILGSLVGIGHSKSGADGPSAVWAVGDKIERRLALHQSETELIRFKVLRAELSTSKSLVNKA